MPKLALQFPLIRHSFNAVFRAFNAHFMSMASSGDVIDVVVKPLNLRQVLTSRGGIPLNRLTEVVASLSDTEINETQLRAIFKLDQLEQQQQQHKLLSFRDFLLTLVFKYYLSDENKTRAQQQINLLSSRSTMVNEDESSVNNSNNRSTTTTKDDHLAPPLTSPQASPHQPVPNLTIQTSPQPSPKHRSLASASLASLTSPRMFADSDDDAFFRVQRGFMIDLP